MKKKFKPKPKATGYLSYAALFYVLLSFTVSTTLVGQESINASGGTAKNANGEVSCSVGQLTYTEHKGTSGSINQGVQVAYVVTEVSGIDNHGEISSDISVFPNPSTDYLTLRIGSSGHETEPEFHYQLFSLNGELIQNGTLKSSETKINMPDQVSGTYFLKLFTNNEEIKTFKILKK